MADFTLSKSLFKGKHRDPSSLPGNIAYAVFVLFCFWAGAQILNLLAHAPGIYEDLMLLQMPHDPVQIAHPERQMAQATGLRA